MKKKLLANKKILILGVIVVLVFVVILVASLMRKDSGEDGKLGFGSEIKEDKDGDGLEVEETLDESVYTIDGSGDWDGTTDNYDNTNNASLNDKSSNKKQPDSTKQEEYNEKNESDNGELDDDILVDDKVWGDIS